MFAFGRKVVKKLKVSGCCDIMILQGIQAFQFAKIQAF
jgi:hypothetical protein